MTLLLNDIDLKLLNSKYKDGVVFETNSYIEYKGENFNLLGLKKVFKISAKNAYELNTPYLEECVAIDTAASKINAPMLKILNSGDMYNVVRLSFPKLEECIFLHCPSAIGVDIPLLKSIKTFYCNSAVTINLPSLEFTPFGGIKSSAAKKIIISKHLEQRLTNVPEDCEIINPEGIQQESFKSFFNR
jgi:hypothetical protein